MVTEKSLPLSQDAALVAALAGTAMPFSHSAEDQAERWLRAMRLHGEVGTALQALGVGEAPLMSGCEGSEPAGTPPLTGDVVKRVVDRAGELAEGRSATAIGTTDVLFALLEVYHHPMDRALYVHGTSRAELVERLGNTVTR